MTIPAVEAQRAIPAVHPWKNNAELIADCWSLGYITPFDQVLDMTYGKGRFWTLIHPYSMVRVDKFAHVQGGIKADFRQLPFEDARFDVAVFDPPYKLSGTPSATEYPDYGIQEKMSPHDRMAMICDGLKEATRVVRKGGYVLVKCQDQVCSGKVWWQTDMVTRWGFMVGLAKVDRFDMTGHSRPQPSGRRQVHAHGRPSTLLVLQRRN